MIGYAVLGTNDLARAASFYDELLAEMGVSPMMEFGDRGYAWAAAMDKPMLCIMTPYDGQPATVGNGVMAGIAADSHDQVDRIYMKAIELGGFRGAQPKSISNDPLNRGRTKTSHSRQSSDLR